jgi:hypothetical protein
MCKDTYFVDVAILVDALHESVPKGGSLRAVNHHLVDAALLGRGACGIAHEGDAAVGLHQAWVVGLRGVWVGGGADIDAARRLGMSASTHRENS